jgi:DNA-binding MarR family transcriptional regulator
MKINIPIKVENKVELYSAYLSIVNWTLKDKLSDKEIDILAYFMYYNEMYSNIPEEEAKIELLMSSSTKKKIREKLKISSSMFETYLGRLKKKNYIGKNGLSLYIERIKLDKEYTLSFEVIQSKKQPVVEQRIPIVEETPVSENIETSPKASPEYEEQNVNIIIPSRSGYAELEELKKMMEETEDDNLEYEDL